MLIFFIQSGFLLVFDSDRCNGLSYDTNFVDNSESRETENFLLAQRPIYDQVPFFLLITEVTK